MRSLTRWSIGLFILGALALVVSGPTTAGEKKGKGKGPTVKVGDKAPVVESVDETGKPWKSSDVVGKKILVLYFYPADFTGGCTKQACGFRDDVEKLSSQGVQVVGVSGDSVATHKLFKSHHKLNFPLLADEKGEVAKAFGIAVNKGGKANGVDESGAKVEVVRSVTIPRYTVVVDKAGNVAAIDAVNDAGGDAKRVADLVKKLDTK
jgi:peroxiredoxin Q/BCP